VLDADFNRQRRQLNFGNLSCFGYVSRIPRPWPTGGPIVVNANSQTLLRYLVILDLLNRGLLGGGNSCIRSATDNACYTSRTTCTIRSSRAYTVKFTHFRFPFKIDGVSEIQA
jgi:hypothetical protein